jgi:murein DD-endopeptidase MepM/ murein hydrolase activator NlpD
MLFKQIVSLLKLNKLTEFEKDKKELVIFSKYSIHFLLLAIIFIIYTFFSNLIISYNDKKINNFNELVNSNEFENVSNYFFANLKSPYSEHKYTIKNNDSIQGILNFYKIKTNEINFVIDQLKKRKLSNIYTGRQVSLVLKKTEDNRNSIVNIYYPISNTLNVEIRNNNNEIIIKENIIKLNKREVVVKNYIKNNLYQAALDVGVEPNIIIEFARIYGFEIDFQRDIRKGDWFEIYYEKFVDDNNNVKDTGKIIYASMFVNNKELNLYNFKDKSDLGYYDLNGKSIVKALMKTPINGARLSSPFGNRKHPILGFTKHHNGTDFAALTGTPIMASGSGTVITAGWCGNGGNCVRIRHNSSYTTGYGHLSKFATKKGRKVKQGQIIGYVGNTGMSTGPHLHYTVKYNGKFVNSQSLKLPSGKILKGDKRKEFEIERIKIDLKLSELRDY